jgi:hypothetical protein
MRSQVIPSMTLVGSSNEPPNRRGDVVADAIGGIDAVLGDEIPDLDEVDFRFWMKREFVHPRARGSSLLRCKRSSTSSPLIGFTCPLLISELTPEQFDRQLATTHRQPAGV